MGVEVSQMSRNGEACGVTELRHKDTTIRVSRGLRKTSGDQDERVILGPKLGKS